MNKYFVTEAEEDIQMDVQVGPKEEIEAEVEELNPVDMAKKEPENVPIAGIETKEGVQEFYVDAKDVEKYADLNEMSMVEALNSIIEFHADSPIDASNLVVVMDESTKCYARTLEKNGAACVVMEAADEEAQQEDIEIDVQVGPNEEEETVSADPQEANPVDAVKREYDNVIVAKQGDEFFMDVEDVQKCAELNCESVIETLNKIIDVNESYGITADNIVLIMNEACSEETIEALNGVNARFFLESTSVADIAGLTPLVHKLIAAGKKVIGTVKGDKDASAKSIQYQIDKLDEQIARIDDEIAHAYDKGAKITAKRITKNFIGNFIVLMGSYAIGTAAGIGIYDLSDRAASIAFNMDREPMLSNKERKGFAKVTAIVGTVISAVTAGATTAVILSDYERSLKEWKKNLVESRKALENKLKHAK